MKIRWFGMVAQIDSFAIVSYNVFGARVLRVASLNQFEHSKSRFFFLSRLDWGEVNETHFSKLKGVTISGKVMFWAILLGTPTWSIRKLGSGVMTVRAEKSTRLPIKLPRILPSFPFRRALIDFSGFPDFCIALKCFGWNFSVTRIKGFYLGKPGMSLSTRVATWNCSIFTFSTRICVAAPDASFFSNSALIFMISANLWVKSSWFRAEPFITTAGLTGSGGTGNTVATIQSGRAYFGSIPRTKHSSSRNAKHGKCIKAVKQTDSDILN